MFDINLSHCLLALLFCELIPVPHYITNSMFKNICFGEKIPNGALSRNLNLPNDKESNAVSQTAVQPALYPEASNSWPDWPEDMGVGRKCRENIFEFNFYYFSPGPSIYP